MRDDEDMFSFRCDVGFERGTTEVKRNEPQRRNVTIIYKQYTTESMRPKYNLSPQKYQGSISQRVYGRIY